MTAQIIPLRANTTHHTQADILRADCERLMRRLVRERQTPVEELRALADFLDYVIEQSERKDK